LRGRDPDFGGAVANFFETFGTQQTAGLVVPERRLHGSIHAVSFFVNRTARRQGDVNQPGAFKRSVSRFERV
jgi:hypothetical protein